MTKIAVTSAGRQDQVVIGDRLIVHEHKPRLYIYACHLSQHHVRVFLLPEYAANGCADISRGYPGCRDLVQEGLKQVMVIAVNHRHLDRYVA